MADIIIGNGEIGSAVAEVLSPYYQVAVVDKSDPLPMPETCDIMHVCIPYTDTFIDTVKEYQKTLQPDYTVVHSTVPVGTCAQLNALHSPVRGKHPDLAESIRTFVKFVGGPDADEVADRFRYAGMTVQICRKQETTELGKLASTLQYGVIIEMTKEIERMCEAYDVPFNEAYTLFQQTYNEGYEQMGMSHVKRPVLQPLQKKIGGHCVLENADLLEKSRFAQLLKELNGFKHQHRDKPDS